MIYDVKITSLKPKRSITKPDLPDQSHSQHDKWHDKPDKNQESSTIKL